VERERKESRRFLSRYEVEKGFTSMNELKKNCWDQERRRRVKRGKSISFVARAVQIQFQFELQ